MNRVQSKIAESVSLYDNFQKTLKTFDNRPLAIRMVRELKMMKYLSHPRLLGLKNYILPRQRDGLEHLYLVFPLKDQDLYMFLKKKSKLDLQSAKFLCYQMAEAVQVLHTARVIHRDIKPRNFLLSKKVKRCGERFDSDLVSNIDFACWNCLKEKGI